MEQESKTGASSASSDLWGAVPYGRQPHHSAARSSGLVGMDLGKGFFKNNYFIYLAVPGLSCGTLDLLSSLWHAGSLVVACKLLVAACGI